MTARAAIPRLERRRERRVTVRLPMMVRGTGPDGESFEERTFSEDMCRGGAAFAIRNAVTPGTNMEVSISATPSASDPDADFSTQGRVVHVKPGRHKSEVVVGVEFTGPRFHRIFVSESTS